MRNRRLPLSRDVLFAIIIPTYNRAAKLRRALESLAAQSCPHFEVIVCDDGSTDETRAVVEEFSNRMTIVHHWEENSGGPARPRNHGIRLSTAPWVCFLDADDWWYPEKLLRIATELEGADFIFHDCDVVTPAGTRRLVRKSGQPRHPVFVDFMTRGCRVITSSVCVRRELLIKGGLFTEDPVFVAIEDTDLWLQISLLTERFRYIPERLGVYWEDGSNISGFSEKYISRITALHDKFAGRLDPADRKEAELLLAYRTAIVLRALGRKGESRQLFKKTLAARNPKIRLYSALYLMRLKLNL
jgi:glycosyltransferase involved in cell wall biosynthesis